MNKCLVITGKIPVIKITLDIRTRIDKSEMRSEIVNG